MTIQKQDLDRLMHECQSQLRGATNARIRGVMFNVIDEFLSDSNSWVEWVPFSIAANVQNYTLPPAKSGQIKRLGPVIDSNCVVYPATITDLQPPSVNIWLVWPQNQSISVNAITYKSIVLPNQHGDIPDAPVWLLPQYSRAIEDGIVGRIMMETGSTYSNPQAGAVKVKSFRDKIAMARAQAARGYLYGGQAWRFPRSFATNSQRGGVSTAFPQPTSWGI